LLISVSFILHLDECNLFLKCENIVEEMEETLLEMFATEAENQDIELCSKRSKYCEPVVIQDDYEFEKEEL